MRSQFKLTHNTSFSLDPSAMFGKPDFNRKFVQGFVTILNSGKVAANGIRIMLDANPPHADRYFVVVEKDNLAPGASEMLRIEIPITSSRDFTVLDDSREFVVELKTEYDDGVHADKKTYSEMFCIAESKTVTHQLTPLYSCNTHFDKGSSDVR